MNEVLVILLGLGAYLLGSIPTAYILVSRVAGTDVREVGTGNVGALNAYHQLGAWAGVLVLVIDAGKGAFAVLAPGWLGAPEWTLFLTTPLVVAGHNWPIFLNFRGGKGAAGILGISLALLPILTLIAIVPTLAAIALLRNVVWGAAFGFVLVNVLLATLSSNSSQVALCLSLTLLVTVTYLASVRIHIYVSIKERRWRDLFTGLA